MRSEKLFLIFISCVFVVGCATTKDEKELEPPRPKVYLSELPEAKDLKSFQHLISEVPGTLNFERARIEYLLERLGKSPHQFVRNSEIYSPPRAVIHLRWKYWRKKESVLTAEDFVKRIATRSHQTGRIYWLRKESGESHPLHLVFTDELEFLDEAYLGYQEKLKEEFEKSKEARPKPEGEELPLAADTEELNGILDAPETEAEVLLEEPQEAPQEPQEQSEADETELEPS